MKITAIAIFDQCLSADEISAFKWERNWTATQPGDWSDSANWEGGVVPQNGDTVIIPVDAVVNVDDEASLAGVAIEGSGTIVYDNKLPDNEKTNYQAAAWTGTVWIKNKAVTGNDINHIGTIGNAGSTVRFTGVSGWLNNGTLDTLPTLDLVDEDATVALSINNGSSGTPLKFRQLTGAGTFTTSGASSQKFYFENGEGFTGSITMQSNKGILFGATTGTVNNNQIVIAAGATANIAAGKIWTAAGGIVVNGEVDVTVDPDHPAFAGTVSGSGRVVMIGKGQNGASLRMDKAAFTGCTAAAWTGTLEIRDWRGETEASYSKFGDTHGNANSTICFNGFKGYAYASNYNAVKAYEIGENGFTISGSYTGGRFGFVGALTGSGTITLSQTGSMNANSGVNFIGDSSGFTGTFAFANTTTYRVALLASANDALPSETAAKKVILGTGVKTGAWTANGDFVAMDGAIFDADNVPTVTGTLTFPATAKVELAEDVTDTEGALILTKTGLGEGTDYPTVVSATVAGEPSGFAYRFKSATDGVKVFQQSSINWVGGDGSLTDDAKWSGGTFAQDGENCVAYFPADDTATVTIPDGTEYAKSFYVKGDYTFKGETAGQPFAVETLAVANGAKATLDGLEVTPEQLAISEGGTLALSNGAKLNMETLELAAGMTLELSSDSMVALQSVPTLNSAATIKIADAENLKPGNYLLMSWETTKDESVGYGKPLLDITGYVKPERVRLIPEVKKLWLQVISDEQAARKPLVIMPFGDSITEGINMVGTYANYRIPLFQKLSLAGYNVKSVGYWKSAAGFSRDPSGTNVADEDWLWHSGRGSARLAAHNTGNAALLDMWSNALDVGGDPDIILMHIGINDMLNNAQGQDLTSEMAFTQLTNLATRILAARPNSKLVISSIMGNEYGHSCQKATTKGDRDHVNINETYVEPVRDMLVAFMKQVKKGEIAGIDPDRLFFANMCDRVRAQWYADEPATHFNIHNGNDHCHPDWLGHDMMAEAWLEQIQAAYPNPDADFHGGRTEAEKGSFADSELTAEANVPTEYRNGFTKARTLKLTGTTKIARNQPVDYTTTNNTITADTAVEKVGYYIDYVRATETTNIHRWVWVDMDAFGDNETKTFANVEFPASYTRQQVVTDLHVVGNHPGVWNVKAGESGVKGFIEFTPWGYNDNAHTSPEGAPASWFTLDWHDNLPGTGDYGCFQVARILDTPECWREAQMVFAYNGWTTKSGATEMGIGNFAQSFTTSSLDWTYLRDTVKGSATNYTAMAIEIWVKPVATGPAIDPSEGTITKDEASGAYIVEPAADVTEINIANLPDGAVVEIPSVINKVSGAEQGTIEVFAKVKEQKFYITDACKTDGGVIELDDTKSVTVDGETIPVKPVLSDADDDVKPLQVSSDSTAVGVKTIPGLTYTLVRSGAIGGDTTDVYSDTATGVRLELTDDFDPEKGGRLPSAFYVIRVTK